MAELLPEFHLSPPIKWQLANQNGLTVNYLTFQCLWATALKAPLPDLIENKWQHPVPQEAKKKII